MSAKGKSKNNLNSPLFCMGVYKDFVLITGGGGGKAYGLPNTIKVYKREFPVGNSIFEMDFDTELLSYFQFGYKELNYFCAAISKNVAIFQIDPKSGNLDEIKRIEADFHEKTPEVTKVRWSQDNKLIVSGGEDGVMRVFRVNYSGSTKIDGFELAHELGIHSEAINDVCINQDNTLAISSSSDKTCRIYSLKDEK